MSNQPKITLDIPHAHRYFSAHCFNQTWALIDIPNRRPADDEATVLCATASLWHWTQRSDCNNQTLSVGHWQVSRACALAKQGEAAMRHARRSLELAQGLQPFFVGYAHEGVARAALLQNDPAAFQAHLAEARTSAQAVSDKEERSMLEQNLTALEAAAATNH